VVLTCSVVLASMEVTCCVSASMDVTPIYVFHVSRNVTRYIQSVRKLCAINDRRASGCQYESKMSNEHRSRNVSVTGFRG
jgi:hypothetical protein